MPATAGSNAYTGRAHGARLRLERRPCAHSPIKIDPHA